MWVGQASMPKFYVENFHGWLSNREIRESVLPQKFPAVLYSVCSVLSL
jgi:hypothetical protein